MNKVLLRRLRVAVRVLGATVLAVTVPVHAAKPPPSGGGATTVATTTMVQGDWTITRLLTPQGPPVGFDVGFTGDGMARIGQTVSGASPYFLWQDGGGWQKQQVVKSDISNSLCFAVASDGRAAMAFATGGGNGTLQYAERDFTGTWQMTTVESRYVTGSHGYVDLEFDSAGNPALAYSVGSGDSKVIKLARRIGGVWQKQTVAFTFFARRLSLDFDETTPFIAHTADVDSDGNSDTVLLLTLSGSNWTSEVMETDTTDYPTGWSVGVYLDLSINPGGEPEVVHGSGFVRYVKKAGALWVSEQLEDSQAVFGATIDHDSSGAPHVVLRKDDGLWHSSRDAGGWNWSKIRDVDPAFYDLGRPRVRIDRQGRPAVLYLKDGNGSAVEGGVELELAHRSF